MSHTTTFYKVTCDQDDAWVRICISNQLATEIKADMELKHAPNTYTITQVDLSGDANENLATVWCQMADVINPASNGEWT